ncbi:helix-hairpin-helix domain-containing protein [Mucilaginibacter limnophilus]|uniref:Helix-hairpin-helix domain-containing protein n=1 Tax=Mucilaginibacter limnophilus TaxID=1932778 RepID=A0A3S2WVJ2_9SPHI|nr:helix-hairpin-helix domain-containing protein [Mucilaginibacter limnophilus]RVT96503.1 helix-hairpin-helix domain-containing protein [Mucilaginibacter limnophilus]
MLTNIKAYLSITKKQWNGLVVMVLLVTAIPVLNYVNQGLSKDSTINHNSFKKAIARLNQADLKAEKSFYINKETHVLHKKIRLTTPVEINSADSATLTTVYGIGPSFARRIIKYRELLGGFYSKEQLKEVYGLDENKYLEIKDQLKIDASAVKKININKASAYELNRLPYLDYKQANAIEQYRLQHGNYTSAAALQEIMILDKQTIDKIKPYLSFK